MKEYVKVLERKVIDIDFYNKHKIECLLEAMQKSLEQINENIRLIRNDI